jgi:hypothetical protein
MITWLVLDLTLTKRLDRGAWDRFMIETELPKNDTAAWYLNQDARQKQKETSISCTCSLNSSDTGAGGSIWGQPYATIKANTFCPDLPWDFCDTQNVPLPDPQTPTGNATYHALVKFCAEVKHIMIAPPATSLLLTKEAWQSARLVETRSKRGSPRRRGS